MNLQNLEKSLYDLITETSTNLPKDVRRAKPIVPIPNVLAVLTTYSSNLARSAFGFVSSTWRNNCSFAKS